jgi:hypothetical protein
MPSQVTLKDAAPQFLEQLRAAGNKEPTLRTYAKAIEVTAGFFGETKSLKALRPVDVARFLRSDALLKKSNGKDRAKPTVDQIARVFRMLLEWAQSQGVVESVAFPKDAMPKRRRKQRGTQQPETTPDAAQAGN